MPCAYHEGTIEIQILHPEALPLQNQRGPVRDDIALADLLDYLTLGDGETRADDHTRFGRHRYASDGHELVIRRDAYVHARVSELALVLDVLVRFGGGHRAWGLPPPS